MGGARGGRRPPLEARDGRVIVAEPFAADNDRAGDRGLVVEERGEIAAFAQIDDLRAVPFDPVGLGREYECALSLLGKFPGATNFPCFMQ